MKPRFPEHSAAKVRLLGSYLSRYLSIIANDGYTQRIRIFDLFCGEGLYDNDGEGSPIVIIRAVKDLFFSQQAKSKPTPKIDCLFNDKDADKIANLEKSIAANNLHYEEIGDLQLRTGEYDDIIRTLLRDLQPSKYEKVFVFIDPYGYKHVRATHISGLLAKGNVEVLLFLPTQFMYRFNANGTPEALIDFIEEVVDYKDWKPTENIWNFIDQLRSAFRGNLGSKVFVDTFTIQKDPQTVFCLFFFSSHIKGFEKMLEAKWQQDAEQGKGWHFSDSYQTSLLVNFKTNPLEEKLKIFLNDQQRTNGDVYEFTLRSGFLPKHATEIFTSLQKAGRLTAVAKGGSAVRKNAFYINYRAYRDESDKVRFSLT